MTYSILELYLLSLIDRGLRSKYDLQRQGGVSLGSSSPALMRLVESKLIRQQPSEQGSGRPRQQLSLTPSGRKAVRTGWRAPLANDSDADLEAIMRVADMAIHYGASPNEIASYLRRVAAKRKDLPGALDRQRQQLRWCPG